MLLSRKKNTKTNWNWTAIALYPIALIKGVILGRIWAKRK